MRIPIGFWAYNNTGTPYITGADAYLEKAIGWARNSGMKVCVDMHGSPGSQNGFDNSGHAGPVQWQQGDNLNRSTAILKTFAQKYGASQYADVVVGIEIVNEPISWGNNSLQTTQSWAESAFKVVRAASTNQNIRVVSHDGFMGAMSWNGVSGALNGGAGIDAAPFGVDVHLYQLYTDAYNAMNQTQHINATCQYAATDLQPAKNANIPVYVGEWSALTNVCVNPDGSTTAGTSCSTAGCQCLSTTQPAQWTTATVTAVRQMVEAQLYVWETFTRGYFLWSYGAPGGWSVDLGVQMGWFPSNFADMSQRKYPNFQC